MSIAEIALKQAKTNARIDRYQYVNSSFTSEEEQENKERMVAAEFTVRAVEKQIPKIGKARWEGEDFGECPACGKAFLMVHNYCPRCGQAVEWEE